MATKRVLYVSTKLMDKMPADFIKHADQVIIMATKCPKGFQWVMSTELSEAGLRYMSMAQQDPIITDLDLPDCNIIVAKDWKAISARLGGDV